MLYLVGLVSEGIVNSKQVQANELWKLEGRVDVGIVRPNQLREFPFFYFSQSPFHFSSLSSLNMGILLVYIWRLFIFIISNCKIISKVLVFFPIDFFLIVIHALAVIFFVFFSIIVIFINFIFKTFFVYEVTDRLKQFLTKVVCN